MWDWPWLLFIAYKELNWTAEQFWNSTPSEFQAMMECLERYNALKAGKTPTSKREVKAKPTMPHGGGSLDDLPGW